MRKNILHVLRCPTDLAQLHLETENQDPDGHIMSGFLRCTECQKAYPIRRGVPNFVPGEKTVVDGKNLTEAQYDTRDFFGFEWTHYKDWGWLEDYPDVSNAEEKFSGGIQKHSHEAFWGKSLFEKGDLGAGLLVLDAGCGNGRFSNEAAKSGAEVVGIDLGESVYRAFEHTRHLENVHICRGDLFRLPFAEEIFDRAFSIGVLMHTGNAGAAFDSIAHRVKSEGLVVAHVYGRGWTSYELLTPAIRAITTRLPTRMLMRFARFLAVVARWLRATPARQKFYWDMVYPHINLLPTDHHMFDLWGAPTATHQTQEEVRGWFARSGVEILRTTPTIGDEAAEAVRRKFHASITVLGRKNSQHK